MKNSRYTYIIFMIIGLILLMVNSVSASNKMTLFINDNTLKDLPYAIEDGELLTPARIVLEALGGDVEWYGGLKVLRVLFDGDHEFRLWVDNNRVAINPGGRVVNLSVPPRLVDGQTMIPLKFFADQLGLLFKWNDKEKVGRVFKPSNWVLDLSFEEGLSGELLTITSTKKVPYVSHVLGHPDRLVIDLKQSSLSARSSDILWQSYAFNSVRLSQYDIDTVRVVIELNNKVQYQIVEEESQEGFKIIVAFAPGVREVYQDSQGIHIKSSGEIVKYSVLELVNPARLVIDIEGQTMQLGSNVIPMETPYLKQIRASQLSWSPKVVRLVLDLSQQIEYNVLRGQTAQEIILQIKEKVKHPNLELIEEEKVPDEVDDEITEVAPPASGKPHVVAEFILVDLGKEYGDHELVSVGITEGINQRIIIRTSTPLYYNVIYLSNPERVVVDLQGATVKMSKDQIPKGKGVIKNVRMHQYPDKVRIVFDLNQNISYKILSEPRTQVIEIGLGRNPLEGKVIMIDPGHGGQDPGAISSCGIYEKTINLSMGLLLRDMLKNSGATVFMTRDKDVYPTLTERTDLANQLNADIFISLHCNSFKGEDPGGTETFMSPVHRENNLELAKSIHNNLVKVVQLFDRGIKFHDFHVLKYTTMPAVLVEVAFISKTEELKLLKEAEFLEKAIAGIYEGILEYFTQLEESGDTL